MSDAELRRNLKALGYNPGPITPATRELYEKKLSRLRTEARRSVGHTGGNAAARPAPARRSWAGPEKRKPVSSRSQREEEDEDDDDDDDEDYDDREDSGLRYRVSPISRPWILTSPLTRHDQISSAPTAPRERTVPAPCTARSYTTSAPPITRPRTPESVHSTRLNWLRGPNDPPTPWARVRPAWDSEGEEEEKAPRVQESSWRPWGSSKPQIPYRRPAPSRRPRALERILSWLLIGASVALLAVFLGIMWVKSSGSPAREKVAENLQQMPMDCEGRTDPYCQREQKKIVQQMLFELYNFLAKQAGSFECGNPDRLKSKCIPVEEARAFVANISGHSPEKFDLALQRVMNSNRDLGIWVRGNDPFSEPVASLDKVACLESTRPELWLSCRLSRALSTAVTNLILLFWALALLWGLLAFLKYRWRKIEEAEQAMYDMVNKITEVVRDHYKDWESGMETFPYVGVCHVRDTLIPHRSRKQMLPVWHKAVDFLSANESRIRTESHRIAGEDMLVWRWTRSAKYSDS
ncbi:LEM domain-containing protein 2 [Lissotriton helveticus]